MDGKPPPFGNHFELISFVRRGIGTINAINVLIPSIGRVAVNFPISAMSQSITAPKSGLLTAAAPIGATIPLEAATP